MVLFLKVFLQIFCVYGYVFNYIYHMDKFSFCQENHRVYAKINGNHLLLHSLCWKVDQKSKFYRIVSLKQMIP